MTDLFVESGGSVTLGVVERDSFISSLTLRYGLFPDVILTFKADIPTGDGSISPGGGVALVKSFDPVVLFANVNYGHTFARDFSDVTPRKRESFDPQSGPTSLLASGFYIEPTVSFNLNGVGNDVVLGLSLPYTFQSGL